LTILNLDDLRQLIESEGGKVVIIENGKQPLVLTTLEEYKKAKQAIQPPMSFGTQFAADVRPVPKEFEEEPLKIEDLPV
jgi:PHD/YefM family antitoxin component YafN of YafNO toxin-antitoxin module